MLYPRVPMAVIVGIRHRARVPLTLVAGLGHWWLGSVDWPLLTSLLSGSIPGIVARQLSFGARSRRRATPDSGRDPDLVGSRLVF